MSVSVTQLMALKAFYLGHGIASSKTYVNISCNMVDAAIRQFEGSDSPESVTRTLFYILLKAEIQRGTPDALTLRAKAKMIAETHGSDVYRHYMSIEEATQTRSKVEGLETGIIGNKGVQAVKKYSVENNRFSVSHVEFDAALNALDLRESELKQNDINFLRKVTLKDILDRHNVAYAPVH